MNAVSVIEGWKRTVKFLKDGRCARAQVCVYMPHHPPALSLKCIVHDGDIVVNDAYLPVPVIHWRFVHYIKSANLLGRNISTIRLSAKIWPMVSSLIKVLASLAAPSNSRTVRNDTGVVRPLDLHLTRLQHPQLLSDHLSPCSQPPHHCSSTRSK